MHYGHFISHDAAIKNLNSCLLCFLDCNAYKKYRGKKIHEYMTQRNGAVQSLVYVDGQIQRALTYLFSPSFV